MINRANVAEARAWLPLDGKVVGVALALLALLAWQAQATAGGNMAALAIVGASWA